MLRALIAAVDESVAAGLLTSPPGLSGYSGDMLVGLLQRLARALTDERRCYLEVGVFQGLTLLSVAHANPESAVFGIDDFSQFDPSGENQRLVESRRSSLGLDQVSVINRDFEDAFADLESHLGSRRLAVYFVDGPHDYRSQLMCLELALPYLADDCAIVIDDCNYEHVRQATVDFLTFHPEFALLFEAYTEAHPTNMSKRELDAAKAGWWNGVNVLVRDRDQSLERILPPTTRDRSLYLNEHVIHADRAGRLAPEAVALADATLSLNPLRGLVGLVRLIGAARDPQRGRRGSHRHRNAGCDGGWSRRARELDE